MPPLKLDGSNGISGIDGTVNRPAVVGVATTTGLQFGTDEINFVTGGTNRVEVNASNAAVVTIPQDGNQLLLKQTDTDSGYLMGCNNTNGDLTFSRRALGSNFEKFRMLTGGGLTFNGDTATANALNDYEEGTFTPADASGAGLVFTNNTGVYTKIGSIVFCYVRFFMPSNSSGTQHTVGGFPFNNSGLNAFSGGYIHYSGTGIDLNYRRLGANSFVATRDGGATTVSNSAMSGDEVQALFVYNVG